MAHIISKCWTAKQVFRLSFHNCGFLHLLTSAATLSALFPILLFNFTSKAKFPTKLPFEIVVYFKLQHFRFQYSPCQIPYFIFLKQLDLTTDPSSTKSCHFIPITQFKIYFQLFGWAYSIKNLYLTMFIAR